MAAGRHKAIIEIEAKVAGADAKLKKLEAQVSKLEKATTRQAKASKAAGEAIQNMLAGAASVEGLRRLDALVQDSIKYQNVMANLPFAIDKARKSTKDLISDYDLAKSAVAAHALGITKNAEQYAKFSEAAVKLGSKLGIDTPQAMEQLTAAVGRGSAKILDNFGIMAKGFESMSMEERLNLISEAANDTALVVDENAQSWNRLKNELDNLKNDAFPLIISFAGQLAEEMHELKDAIDGVAFDIKAQDWGSAIGNLGTAYVDLMSKTIPLNSAIEELGETLSGASGDGAQYTTVLDMVNQATGRNIQSTDTWMQKLRRMRGEIPDVNALMMTALIGQSGKTAGRDAAIISAGQKATAAANKEIGKGRGKGRGRGKKGDFLDQFKSDSFTETGAGDKFKQELIDEEAGGIEREIELMQMRQELAESGSQTEAQLHSMKMAALEETFDAEMRLAELRGDEHQAEVLRLQKQMELRSEESRHSDALAKLEAKRQQERAQQQQAILNLVQQVGDGMIQTASMVTNAMGLEGEKQAKAEGIIQGTRSMFIGGLEMVKAVSSFAGFNYIEGAMHLSAATFAFMQAGLMMAGTAPRGGAGGASAGGGGGGGGMFATGGSGGGYREPTSSAIPGSPSGRPPAGTQGGGQSGGGNTYNVSLMHVGKIDREGATTIKQGLEDLDHSSGRVRA